MVDTLELNETPQARRLYMLAGWRQWADAGSVSSALPQYLIQQTDARRIGQLRPEGFYLFQIPGTHDLVRPVVKFNDGFPQSLETPRNEFFYAGDDDLGMVFFLGDEPHLDAERYVTSLLDAAEALNVQRIVGLGGVYGELPYDKERLISSTYSQMALKAELDGLAVTYSDYHGGASIGSFLCRRAAERDIEYVSFYAFVPAYGLANFQQLGNSIRIENDFMAWLGVVRRLNHMLKTRYDLTDLEQKSARLIEVLDDKVTELDGVAPQAGVREYFARLSEEFEEMPFDPLGEVWAEEISRLFGEGEDEEGAP